MSADGLPPELQAALQEETQRAQIQQTIARVTEVCWEKCIGNPGRSFSSREETCLSDCSKRYMESLMLIMQRLNQGGGGAGGGGSF
ncbi:hypothetical protein WJX74_003481 [Apatococcus lobatus]|uniref:Mitochondrial import inner membrane translocase subunit n=2 Tax=Apatococcus TaxID=904362 RepID=A0AAW1T468_9CHLO